MNDGGWTAQGREPAQTCRGLKRPSPEVFFALGRRHPAVGGAGGWAATAPSPPPRCPTAPGSPGRRSSSTCRCRRGPGWSTTRSAGGKSSTPSTRAGWTTPAASWTASPPAGTAPSNALRRIVEDPTHPPQAALTRGRSRGRELGLPPGRRRPPPAPAAGRGCPTRPHRPSSITQVRSASFTVLSRWAITTRVAALFPAAIGAPAARSPRPARWSPRPAADRRPAAAAPRQGQALALPAQIALPRSSSRVSYPIGMAAISSCTQASRAAPAPRRRWPHGSSMAMFSRTVDPNSAKLWLTTPICWRTDRSPARPDRSRRIAPARRWARTAPAAGWPAWSCPIRNGHDGHELPGIDPPDPPPAPPAARARS
jgi:hypothetical protein